jgi:hypothetical protein
VQLQQAFVAAEKAKHDLKAFDCGVPSMNEFLYRHSIKHAKLGLSKTYVLAEAKEQDKLSIAAYYTLTTANLIRAEIPTTASLPSYPIPLVLLARLAVSVSCQGRGLGAKSLVYALRHAVKLSKAGLPAYGLILDVLDDKALAFYKSFDLFKPLSDDPMRLFVPMKTLEQL